MSLFPPTILARPRRVANVQILGDLDRPVLRQPGSRIRESSESCRDLRALPLLQADRL